MMLYIDRNMTERKFRELVLHALFLLMCHMAVNKTSLHRWVKQASEKDY